MVVCYCVLLRVVACVLWSVVVVVVVLLVVVLLVCVVVCCWLFGAVWFVVLSCAADCC